MRIFLRLAAGAGCRFGLHRGLSAGCINQLLRCRRGMAAAAIPHRDRGGREGNQRREGEYGSKNFQHVAVLQKG